MTVEEMHYEFTARFNSQSSEQQKSYLIPEVDNLLNIAQEVFINSKVYPRFSQIGSAVESTNRIIDDLRTIMTTKDVIATNGVVVLNSLIIYGGITPAPELKYFISAIAIVKCDGCDEGVAMKVNVHRHYDNLLSNSLYNTSYAWREIIGVIEDNSLKLDLNDKNKTLPLTCTQVKLSYIRKPLRISNAANFGSGGNIGYYIDNVTLLNTNQNCELPENTHNEIVDLAVVLAARNVSSIEAAMKQQGLQEQYTIN